MLPRDLLRRLTVSLHKYHSTLLPLAWDATPGLVEASYCLLTQVPFNIVTTCVRCYPGTCWGVLLSPYTSTIQHCYHLLHMLPRDLLRRLTVSLHIPFNTVTTCLRCYPGSCWGVLLSPYTIPFNNVTTCLRCYPGTCWGVLLSPYNIPFNIVTTCLRCYPGSCWGVLLSPYNIPFNIVTTCLRCYSGTCWGVLLSPYTSTIQHYYNLLEMRPRDLLRRLTVSLHKYHSTLLPLAWDATRDLLRRLTVSLHKYHSTLLPLAWDATPGLVKASYCLLTQVPFNTVTTCLRCYPGTCWGVLLSPYTSTIQHCYHLLEMLPRDLLRRLSVSLHKYHSTLLPLAWDATPGLVKTSYCLLTQVPFNTVTTCLRCYPGTCWGVLLSPYTSTIQHCYHLLEMLPRDLLTRLTVSLHKYHSTLLPHAWDATPGLVETSYCLLTQVPFNTVSTCVRCYPETCWGVLLSPYTSTIQHCYHLLEMLPRDLLRRLTVSLHKYHSTLLPRAWGATPGLVEASYCLHTYVLHKYRPAHTHHVCIGQ